ncbi:MAG TPA: hypothetical protein PLL10_07100, partial [Elusimicrobiales bacterium]|nr:hypothetical protein [Elusimicrobiales bacterium]
SSFKVGNVAAASSDTKQGEPRLKVGGEHLSALHHAAPALAKKGKPAAAKPATPFVKPQEHDKA